LGSHSPTGGGKLGKNFTAGRTKSKGPGAGMSWATEGQGSWRLGLIVCRARAQNVR
jgi:hypothetical protein